MAAWSGANAACAALGAAVGWTLLWFIYANLHDTVSFDFLGIFVFMPAIGAGIGTGQYLVIRRFLPQTTGWILATAAGWLLGFASDYAIQSVGVPSPMFGFASAGFLQGCLQWLVLRQRGRFTILWPLASTVGWTVSGFVYNRVNEPIHAVFSPNRFDTAASSLTWAAAALFFGLATSLVILRLLTRSE
jgi:hypothetical protein